MKIRQEYEQTVIYLHCKCIGIYRHKMTKKKKKKKKKKTKKYGKREKEIPKC